MGNICGSCNLWEPWDNFIVYPGVHYTCEDKCNTFTEVIVFIVYDR